MTEVFVDHLAYALGEETYTVEETAARCGLVSEPIALREAGFHQHHVCSPKTSAYDLARQSVEQIRGHLAGTGAIVYATCIPANSSIRHDDRYEKSRDVKHLMDFPASHLQADFGLDGAVVLGLTQQACTGLLGSLGVARALLFADTALQAVLCVTADRFPNGALYEQTYNLISDGAAACLVSHQPGGFRLLGWHAITNGALARASDEETAGSFFAYTHRLIAESLARVGLEIGDIRWIVPQNTNAKAVQILARLLRVEPDRLWYPTIAEIGHVISADNFINLKRLDDERRIRAGEKALLFMAGYGLNWQCVILEKV